MRRKRFNAHARMLTSPRFSVASAFVPHLCFLSLLCYVRILLAPFHCPFSLLSLLTPFLCLLGVLFCSVFLISLIYSVTSVLFEFPCFPCVLCLSAFSLYSVFSVFSVFSPIFIFPQTLPCVIKRFPLTTGRKTTTTCVENVLTLTPDHTEHDVLPLTPTPEFHSQDKPGSGEGWRRHWLPKKGDPHRGKDRRNPSTLPGVIRFLHIMRCSLACQKTSKLISLSQKTHKKHT